MFQESEHYEYQYFHGPETRHKGGAYWSCLQGHVGFWWEFYGPSLEPDCQERRAKGHVCFFAQYKQFQEITQVAQWEK